MTNLKKLDALLYRIEEITGTQRELTKRELSYIKLQQDLKSIDEEVKA